MYRVIKMYGDCEPWWFLDGWEEDVVEERAFSDYEAALQYYQKECAHLTQKYDHHKSEREEMTAFWNTTDQIWCESCAEYLQQYYSILLVEALEESLSTSATDRRKRIRLCHMR